MSVPLSKIEDGAEVTRDGVTGRKRTCAYSGRAFIQPAGPGRPRRYHPDYSEVVFEEQRVKSKRARKKAAARQRKYWAERKRKQREAASQANQAA